MAWFSWFRRKDPNDDFESILSELEDGIRVKEERLAFIAHRESRAVVLFTTYSLLAWLAYVALWYTGALDYAIAFVGLDTEHSTADEGVGLIEQAIKTLPVGAVPIVIFFTRRIVRAWYQRKQARENRELSALRKRQREQIEKLKKLSNYDKITQMLERHGQTPFKPMPGAPLAGTPNAKSRPGSNASTPIGKGGANMGHLTPAQQAIMAAQRNTMLAQQQGQGRMGATPATPQRFGQVPPLPQQPGALNMQMHHQNAALSPPPQPRNFLDRLADAAANVLLGDNEQSPASKYALICQRCFAHNGLVLKDEVMDIQFMCPKCGFFNPSRRARMTGATGGSAAASAPIAGAAPAARPIPRAPEQDEGNLSLDSLPSPTLPASQAHARQLASSSSGSDRSSSPTEAFEPDRDTSASPKEKETARIKQKEGMENMRKRVSGKGRTSSADMDLDD